MTPRIMLVGAVTARVMAMGVAVGRSLLKRMRPGQTKSSVLERGEDGRIELQGVIQCDASGSTVIARKGRDGRERDKVTLVRGEGRVYWLALDTDVNLTARTITHVYVPGYPLPVTNEENKVRNTAPYAAFTPFGTVATTVGTIATPADGGVLCPYISPGYVEAILHRAVTGGATGHDPVDFYRRELLDSDGNVVTDIEGREPQPGDYYGVHRYNRSFAKPGETSKGVFRGPPGRLFMTFVSDDGGTGASVPLGLYSYPTKRLRVVEISANSVITGEIESEFSLSGYYDYRYARDNLTGATEFIATVSNGISSTMGGEPVREYQGAGVLYVNREISVDNSPLPIYVLPVSEAEFSTPFGRPDIDCVTVDVVVDWATGPDGLIANDASLVCVLDREVHKQTYTARLGGEYVLVLGGNYCFGHYNYAVINMLAGTPTTYKYSAKIMGVEYSGELPRLQTPYTGQLARVRVVELNDEDEEVERAALLLLMGTSSSAYTQLATLHYSNGDVVDISDVVIEGYGPGTEVMYSVCAGTTDPVLQSMRVKDTGYTIGAEVDRTETPPVVRIVLNPGRQANPVGLISATPTGNGYVNLTMNFPTTEYN